MASTKVTGIVIGGKDIKEKDRLVTLFTPDKGLLTAVLRGVRVDKAKLKLAKEPFSFGEFIIEEGKISNIITGFDMIDNFYCLSSDLGKYYEGCCLLDIVAHSISEPSPAIFMELIRALKTLCYDKVSAYYCVDKFLISVFEDAGYGFLSDKCASCGKVLVDKYFDVSIGDIVCRDCCRGECVVINEDCMRALNILSKSSYENLPSIKVEHGGEVLAYKLLKLNFQSKYNEKLGDLVSF